MGPLIAGHLELTHVGPILLAEQLLKHSSPMLHEQAKQDADVFQIDAGIEPFLPAGSELVVELTADVGEQPIADFVQRLADALTVGDGHETGCGLEQGGLNGTGSNGRQLFELGPGDDEAVVGTGFF